MGTLFDNGFISSSSNKDYPNPYKEKLEVNDPKHPLSNPRQERTDLASGKTSIMQIDYNIAGLLCYTPILLINVIVSGLVLMTEPKSNRFLRFHALQSLFMTGAFFAITIGTNLLNWILGIIPFLGALLNALVWMIWLAVAIIYIWKSISGMKDAYQGSIIKFPLVGDLAEQYIDSKT